MVNPAKAAGLLRTIFDRTSYTWWVQVSRLRFPFSKDRAMQHAIGGEFEAFGIVETELLKYVGLTKSDYVIDVGCGAGRLAKPLSQFLEGRYLGTDVVPDLISYSRDLVSRPDWHFKTIKGTKIPENKGRADFVCFFSVFTHLLHEESYLYLQEAKRVLKPGGKIVFSFLEFAVPCHWEVFAKTVNHGGGKYPLNMFLSRDAIRAFANQLGLSIELIEDGDKPFIPLPHPVILDSGAVMEKFGKLGQSVCVLTR